MKNRIAQGYLTASKHKSQLLEKQPHICDGGDGAMLYTSQGSKIDFCCALGANINGIQNSYSLPTHLENKLANELCKVMPFVDKVKFFKTGSGACSAAVRIARASNSPKAGVGCGYHGNGNTFIAAEKPGLGCMDEGYFKCKDFAHLIAVLLDGEHQAFRGLSYCIIEPFELDYSNEVVEQLKVIRKLCTEKDIVLIFDEVITFGRTPEYTVASFTGVIPDLIIGAKTLGNGYPISFVAGKDNLMEQNYFLSGTFLGEESSLLAGMETMRFLSREKLRGLWKGGEDFQKSFNIVTAGFNVKIEGLPTRAVWKGESVLPFIERMNDKGYFLHPKVFFLNFLHTHEILHQFIDDAYKVCVSIDEKGTKFTGPAPTPIFKRNKED